MSVSDELKDKVNARGVRTAERLELLREMESEGGPERIAARLAQLEDRIRTATAEVRRGLA